MLPLNATNTIKKMKMKKIRANILNGLISPHVKLMHLLLNAAVWMISHIIEAVILPP